MKICPVPQPTQEPSQKTPGIARPLCALIPYLGRMTVKCWLQLHAGILPYIPPPLPTPEWWHMPRIPALWRRRSENQELKARKWISGVPELQQEALPFLHVFLFYRESTTTIRKESRAGCGGCGFNPSTALGGGRAGGSLCFSCLSQNTKERVQEKVRKEPKTSRVKNFKTL